MYMGSLEAAGKNLSRLLARKTRSGELSESMIGWIVRHAIEGLTRALGGEIIFASRVA